MIGWRAVAAGIATALGNHSFRPTGITAYRREGLAYWVNRTAFATRVSFGDPGRAAPRGPVRCG
jgi:hypothetical protein